MKQANSLKEKSSGLVCLDCMKEHCEHCICDKCTNQTKNTYIVIYTCSNCGNEGSKELLKGYEVARGITCDYCGCKTVNAQKPKINRGPFTFNL